MPEPRRNTAISSVPGVSLLRALVDVRHGESLALLSSMLWIFLALTSYYVLKPLRSAMLQERIGVDNKWLALILTTAFVGVFAYGYGKVVPRVARARLIVTTFVGFVVCLALFAVVLPWGGKVAGYAFFVWVSTFNLMIVSQFWSLAADVWTKEEGVRLFGCIGVGGVAGGIFGTLVVSGLAKRLSTEQMLFLAAFLLFLCMLFALHILHFGAARVQSNAVTAGAAVAAREQPPNSAALVLGSQYLRRIALMMLLLNLVNTNNEWILDKMVSRAHLTGAPLKEFYAQFYLLQNTLTFLIQLFLTARIQRRFGAGIALLFEPMVGLVAGTVFMLAPALAIIRWHKILENATDYSIQSNTKELLYLPVSQLEKYSAKAFNDTFVVRGGDALAAAVIYVATSPWSQALGELGLRMMMGLNVLLGLLWLSIAIVIGRMHRAQMDSEAVSGPTAVA
jgi:ATP:ADP antiporter, AAA family